MVFLDPTRDPAAAAPRGREEGETPLHCTANTPETRMSVKERRKALGWSRNDLAERAGLNSALVALIERDQWSDADGHTRVHHVLTEAEGGNLDVRLDPPTGEDGERIGGQGDV